MRSGADADSKEALSYRRQTFRESLLVAGAHLLLIVPFVILHKLGREDVETDFFWEYAPYAERILRGDYPAVFAHRGPGYHVLLSLTGLVVPDLFWAGKLLAMVSAAGAVGLVYALMARHVSRQAALVAALLLAIQPQFLLYSWTVGTDMVFCTLALLSLALLDVPTFTRIIVSALLAGYAFVTRPNGIFLLPAGMTALLLVRQEPRALLKRVAVYASGVCLPFVAWMLTHLAIHGAVPTSYGFRNLMAAATPEMTAMGTEVYKQTFESEVQSFGQVLQEQGWRLVQLSLLHIPQYLALNSALVWGLAVTAGLVLGVVFVIRSRAPLSSLVIPLSGVWLFLSLCPLYYEPRFHLFLSCPAALLTAYALCDGDGWRRLAPRAPRFLTVALFAVIGVGTVAQSLPLSISTLRRESLLQPMHDAAQIVKASTLPGSVAARKPHVAWWSERTFTGIPNTSLADLPDSLHARGVAYLFYGSVELRLHPQFSDLLTVHGIPQGLRLVSVTRGPSFGALFQVLPRKAAGDPVPPELHSPLQQLEEDLTARGIRRQVEKQNSLDLYNRGMFLVTRGRFAEAAPLLVEAVNADSTFGEAFLFLGYALVETGVYRDGLTALQRAQDLGQNTPELVFNKARAYLALGDLDQAEGLYEAYIALGSPSPLSWYHLGLIHSQRGQPAAAESLFARAEVNGLAPDPSFRAARSRALLALGRAGLAKEQIEAGLAAANQDTTLLLLLGLAEKQSGNLAGARAAWQRVLEMDPSNVSANVYMKSL